MSYTNYNDIYLSNQNDICSSPNRINRTSNLFGTYKFKKSNKTPIIKITKNIKKNFFTHNKKVLSKNFIKENYLYNHDKILTYHQNLKNEKDKRCKTFDMDKENRIYKHLNCLHKYMLRGKLVQSKLYKLIEKSANDKYIKKKREKEKNTFITMIDEEDLNENEKKENPKTPNPYKDVINYNINNLKKFKLFKNYKDEGINSGASYKFNKNTPLFNFSKNATGVKNMKYDKINFFPESQLKSYLYREDKDDVNNNIYKKILSHNEAYNSNTKSLELSNLKPISLPQIKFNSSLNNYFKYILEGNQNDKDALSKTSIAKLRFQIINKTLSENYKKTLENKEYPINLADTMFHYYLKQQKYFFAFDDLYKKYLSFLFLEIKKCNLQLNNLLEKREKIFNENNIILKKISDLKEEIKKYEDFKRLCLMVKYKAKDINDIPLEFLSIYGIKLNNNTITEETKDQNINKRKEEIKIRSAKRPKKTIIYNVNKKRESNFKEKNRSSVSIGNKIIMTQEKPVFENIDEFFQKYNEGNDNILKKFAIYNNYFYEKKDYESEFKIEKEIEQSANSKYIKNLIKKYSEELDVLKEKNQRLTAFKIYLLNIKDQDYNNHNYIKPNLINNKDIENKNNNSFSFYIEENKHSISLFKIYNKVREILLNPEINIEDLLKINKLYSIIKEKKTIKDIKLNGNTYSKEVFHIKVLELLYLKLINLRKKCLTNSYLRRKYIRIKNEREKELKIYKAKKTVLDQQLYLMKRNDEIIDKNNKITFAQNKRVDLYNKRYLYDDIIKNKKKIKQKINKSKIESESDNNYNLISY